MAVGVGDDMKYATHNTNDWFMAQDQYGNTFHGLQHPRKDLLDQLGRQHADKMYLDDLEGNTHHIGYIIAGHWLTIYKVTRMDKI